MKKFCSFSFLIFFLFSWNFISNAQSQMIAEITNDIETDFGQYHPYQTAFTPNVPVFSVEPDFSNVNYFSKMEEFNSTESTLLLQNHFTVRKSKYKQLYDVYNSCTWNSTPIFVTTDAVLHTYHVLFDRILSDIEVKKFIETLDLLTESLINWHTICLTQSKRPETKEAVRLNLAFLYVAKKLLKGTDVIIPETVSELVDSELTLISNQDGFHYSPIFGNFSKLDYSQFKPRGHYTKSEILKAYFKTMMWYGRTIFTMEPNLFGDLSRIHTLQALIMARMIYNLEAYGQPIFDLWEKIYETTVFFVGKTDDPNIKDYKIITEQIYGSNLLSISPDSLANPSLLDAFMTEAQKLPEPKIPNWIYGTFTTYKGFRFMGQRFIPDSYMFANLVSPEIPLRFFPKGLDIMAILGSNRAYNLLDSSYNETSYTNYIEKIAQFKTEFAGKSPSDWAQNLYWNWLYCLMPLLYDKGDGYPFFMQTLAWSDKELLTALASWAELRHDTILYAKQSMTPMCIPPGPPKSYVEPNPHLYARLASLVRYTKEGLQSYNLPLDEFQDKLEIFEVLLLFLRDISIKELENTPLSDQEYENIFCFGKVIEDIISFTEDPKPDDMAVIADVHTDSNTNQCLEEGVGYPLEIFVIVNEGGTVRITRGAIFSYYEFLQPISNRLTDEEWREMLAGDTPPAMPNWAESFMDIKASSPTLSPYSPKNLYKKDFTTSIETEDINQIPRTMQLLQNYPNPFNSETTISFDLTEESYVKLIIYNILGQEINVLINEIKHPGNHMVKWDGRDYLGRNAASGIYFYKIETGDFVKVKKMVLLQ